MLSETLGDPQPGRQDQGQRVTSPAFDQQGLPTAHLGNKLTRAKHRNELTDFFTRVFHLMFYCTIIRMFNKVPAITQEMQSCTQVSQRVV